jgi:hypothetical protein
LAADCRAQAEAEILDTAAWYGRRRPAVREAILDAVTAALAAIETNPLQYQIIRGTVRRVRVGRFPIVLLYSTAGDDVVVTVCAHTSRNPGHWHSRFSP